MANGPRRLPILKELWNAAGEDHAALQGHTPRGVVARRSPGRQRTKVTRSWANCGTRPCAPRARARAWAWACVFGAICPAEGKGAGIVVLRCNSEAQRSAFGEKGNEPCHSTLVLENYSGGGECFLDPITRPRIFRCAHFEVEDG